MKPCNYVKRTAENISQVANIKLAKLKL